MLVFGFNFRGYLAQRRHLFHSKHTDISFTGLNILILFYQLSYFINVFKYYPICLNHLNLYIYIYCHFQANQLSLPSMTSKDQKYNQKLIQQFKSIFPSEPYDLQLKIAHTLYNALDQEKKKLFIVESPTGTGKTYSLLVPFMLWLVQNQTKISKSKKSQSNQGAGILKNSENKQELPSWLLPKQNTTKDKGQRIYKELKQQENQLISIQQLKSYKQRKLKINKASDNSIKPRLNNRDEQRLFDDYEIQQEQQDRGENGCKNNNFPKRQSKNILVNESQSKKKNNHYERWLLQEQQKQSKLESQDILPKIIYVSRTHSQLSQIIEAISNLKEMSFQLFDCIKILELSSKELLCVNPCITQNANNVNQLTKKDYPIKGSTILTTPANINLKCQYLLKNGGCPYYQNVGITNYYNKNVSEQKQISERNKVCGYYSMKKLMPSSNLICLPYASILSDEIRTKLNINLHNSMIIFDEGHNILSYQKEINSKEVHYGVLANICRKIEEYLNRYGKLMKANNYSIVGHLLEILKGLMNVIKKYTQNHRVNQQNHRASQYSCHHSDQTQKIGQFHPLKSSPLSYKCINYLQFLLELNVVNVQIQKIKKYVEITNFDQKLAFSQFDHKQTLKSNAKRNHIGDHQDTNQKINCHQIWNCIEFIENLMKINQLNQNNYKILIKFGSKNPQNHQNISSITIKTSALNNASLKILCLNSRTLSEIIRKSRMTVIAGGTMSPLSQFTPLLMEFQQQAQILKYLHIIKPNQCQIYIIRKYQNVEINFNFKFNSDLKSYYLYSEHSAFKSSSEHSTFKNSSSNKANNTNANIEKQPLKQQPAQKQKQSKFQFCKVAIRKVINLTEDGGGIVIFIQNYSVIECFKQMLKNEGYFKDIFFDEKMKMENKQNQDAFHRYKSALLTKQNKKKYILISVMGGKLSEGINFSDNLARSILVFGLPYPNIYAPEIQESMKYYDQKSKENLNQSSSNPSTLLQSNPSEICGGKTMEEMYDGKRMYENICVKTLNQTIGRGIRHIKDYVKIYLIDWRFESIKGKLSEWMRERVENLQHLEKL